jgi:hypothetical protein
MDWLPVGQFKAIKPIGPGYRYATLFTWSHENVVGKIARQKGKNFKIILLAQTVKKVEKIFSNKNNNT